MNKSDGVPSLRPASILTKTCRVRLQDSSVAVCSVRSLDGLLSYTQQIILPISAPSPPTSQLQLGSHSYFLCKMVCRLTEASCRMFCQATGYGGTVQQGSTVEEKLQKRLTENDTSLEAAAAARNLVVNFNADVSDGMNWKFVPTQRSVKINPGQSTLAFYTAHNLSDKAITGGGSFFP